MDKETLNPIAQQELDYWKRDFEIYGGDEGYVEARKGAVPHHTEFFGNYLNAEIGPGLDIGPGLVSIFESLPIDPMFAIEPLQDEYSKVVSPDRLRVKYITGSGEDMNMFEDGQFNFVYCVNVIDHTPNPDKLIAEVRRVLKPGGNFYFQVNFDETLSSCHYQLWRDETVVEYLGDWNLLNSYCYGRPEYNQTLFWAVYKK
jgi:SAM-dependent methyltransferase